MEDYIKQLEDQAESISFDIRELQSKQLFLYEQIEEATDFMYKRNEVDIKRKTQLAYKDHITESIKNNTPIKDVEVINLETLKKINEDEDEQ